MGNYVSRAGELASSMFNSTANELLKVRNFLLGPRDRDYTFIEVPGLGYAWKGDFMQGYKEWLPMGNANLDIYMNKSATLEEKLRGLEQATHESAKKNILSTITQGERGKIAATSAAATGGLMGILCGAGGCPMAVAAFAETLPLYMTLLGVGGTDMVAEAWLGFWLATPILLGIGAPIASKRVGKKKALGRINETLKYIRDTDREKRADPDDLSERLYELRKRLPRNAKPDVNIVEFDYGELAAKADQLDYKLIEYKLEKNEIPLYKKLANLLPFVHFANPNAKPLKQNLVEMLTDLYNSASDLRDAAPEEHKRFYTLIMREYAKTRNAVEEKDGLFEGTIKRTFDYIASGFKEERFPIQGRGYTMFYVS